MKHPDTVDLEILRVLQQEGRISNVELARRIGISAPPCLRRVQALEREGIITGYHAKLDNTQLGFGVTAFAMVELNRQAEADLRAFETLVSSWPDVRECHMLNGEIDFILTCVTRDLESFQTFLTEKLTSAPNVAHVKTAFRIRQSKYESGIPL